VQQTHATAATTPLPRAFDHELSGEAAALVSGALLGAVAWLSVSSSDQLGVFYGVCFVLTALTVALVVDAAGLFIAGVLPPLLMLGVVTVVVVLVPGAIDAPHLAVDAGGIQRVIAGIVDHATALVIGHVTALAIIGLRIRAMGAAPA